MAHTAHTDPELIRERFDPPDVLANKLDQLADLVRASKHMVVFTGAGISTAAGIPDFRGPQGVWTLAAQGKRRTGPVVNTVRALPTATHMGIQTLLERGKLKYLISQNCDGLHRRSGVLASQISELHGNSNTEVCERCGQQYYRDFKCRRKGRARDHATGRLCEDARCKGRLLEFTIDFGQNLPEEALERAAWHSERADLHVVLGSSLTVSPACDLPAATARRGGTLVVCNLQRTPLSDSDAALHIYAKCDDVMRGLLQRLAVPLPPWRLRRRVGIGAIAAPTTAAAAAGAASSSPLSSPPLLLYARALDLDAHSSLEEISLFTAVRWALPPAVTVVTDTSEGAGGLADPSLHSAAAAAAAAGCLKKRRHCILVRTAAASTPSTPGADGAATAATAATAAAEAGAGAASGMASQSPLPVVAAQLRFFGHYGEPPLVVQASLAEGRETVFHLSYDAIGSRQWSADSVATHDVTELATATAAAAAAGSSSSSDGRLTSYGRSHWEYCGAIGEPPTPIAVPIGGGDGGSNDGEGGFQANPLKHCRHLVADIGRARDAAASGELQRLATALLQRQQGGGVSGCRGPMCSDNRGTNPATADAPAPPPPEQAAAAARADATANTSGTDSSNRSISLCLHCLRPYCIAARSSLRPESAEFCSRHSSGCMATHCSKRKHRVAVGLADLSFWCYACADYLDNFAIPELRPVYEALHLAKFGEAPPSLQH